jgi:uncharacterized protein
VVAQVQVHGIGMDAQRAQPIVLLQEVDGQGRILPVWMAESDAAAVVAAQRGGAGSPRPDTHALIGQVLAVFGRTLTGVVITEMRDGAYHARLLLDGGLGIDSRTSDAIALALRAGVGIEATEAVLDRAGVPPGSVVTSDDPESDDGPRDPQAERPVDEADVERFRRMLDDVSPSDFEPDA